MSTPSPAPLVHTPHAESQGTSYHGHSVKCTPADLKRVFGEPSIDSNGHMDKVNLEWILTLTENDATITLYDWEQYIMLQDDMVIDWHIGAIEPGDAATAYLYLTRMLQ